MPYDIGFFSFINELVYADLRQRDSRKFQNLKLGPTSVQCICTQIYNMTRDKALGILNKKNITNQNFEMPIIQNAAKVLKDIYHETFTSNVMKWILDHSKEKDLVLS